MPCPRQSSLPGERITEIVLGFASRAAETEQGPGARRASTARPHHRSCAPPRRLLAAPVLVPPETGGARWWRLKSRRLGEHVRLLVAIACSSRRPGAERVPRYDKARPPGPV